MDCPYCGASFRRGVRFGPTGARIYDAVARAGSIGISSNDLFRVVYANAPQRRRKPDCLKSYIRVINSKLIDARIVWRDGGYALYEVRETEAAE